MEVRNDENEQDLFNEIDFDVLLQQTEASISGQNCLNSDLLTAKNHSQAATNYGSTDDQKINSNMSDLGMYQCFSNYQLPSKHFDDNEEELHKKQQDLLGICRDKALKKLLLLNQKKRTKLKQLYSKIQNILCQCYCNMDAEENSMQSNSSTDNRKMNKTWRLGIPYFKRKDDYPCPRNDDILRKCQNGELSFYDMTPTNRWAEKDTNRLFIGVSFHYKAIRETEIKKQIEELESSGLTTSKSVENEEAATTVNLLNQLKKDLQNLKKIKNLTTLYPPLDYSVPSNDWNRISKNFLLDRFSAEECKVQWTTYIHPDINKSKWTFKESKQLESIATKYKYQNWDLIAKDLGTNRSGFMVCSYYYSKLNPPRHGRFTAAEDNLIWELVERYKQGNYIPWSKLAHYFKNRTRGQLFYRYKYFLSCQNDTYRGKFKESEDILILILVNRFGKQFSKFSAYFPNRSILQIKSRYTSNLRAPIKKGSFTIEEDRLILKYFNEKTKKSMWEYFAQQLKRSPAQIRQRYQTLVNFLQTNSIEDLEKAPRRRYRGISCDIEYDFIRHIADQFKNAEKIPTIEEIEALLVSNNATSKLLLRNNGNGLQSSLPSIPLLQSEQYSEQIEIGCDQPTMDYVDGLLIDYFSNSIKLNFQRNINSSNLSDVAEEVMSLLSNFQAKLCIPKDFRNNSKLDFIDLELLNCIILETAPISDNDDHFLIDERKSANLNLTLIEKIVSPNLNTMIAMRTLLINNAIYKSTNYSKNEIIHNLVGKENEEMEMEWCMDNYLLNIAGKKECDNLLAERKLFFKRFITLFKLPAIMTLQKPLEKLEHGSKIWEEQSKIVQTYQKKKITGDLLKTTDAKMFDNLLTLPPPLPPVSKKPSGQKNRGCAKRKFKSEAEIQNSEEQQQQTPLNMAEKLKKQINDTIKQLTETPPKQRRFKHMT